MKLIRDITDLNKAIKSNRKIGFVPTMGGLHKGHESLINKCKKRSSKTLVSIFVNPRQFNDIKDYKNYPRKLDNDLKILKKLKVDFVFIPTIKQIYNNNNKFLEFKLSKSHKILCAKYRNYHFEGVLNVINRFIILISPKYIFLGEKDFQQFYLIKKFFEKKYATKIILCKTIRNKKKVALSSRNLLLNVNDLKKAGFIAQKLIKLKSQINKDKKKANYLIKKIKKNLINEYNIKIQYLEVRNLTSLKSNIINKKYKVFIAYYINKVRLIDNF
jgi:pantoate--beta-alanine ligase